MMQVALEKLSQSFPRTLAEQAPVEQLAFFKCMEILMGL